MRGAPTLSRFPRCWLNSFVLTGRFFTTKESLYNSTDSCSQRRVPLVRPFIRQAWEMLTRWERRELTRHRFPLTEPVFEAMCSLAIAWGWDRWAAATLCGSTDAAALARLSARQELTCALLEVFFVATAASPCGLGELSQARVQHTTVQWVQRALCQHGSPHPRARRTPDRDRLQWPSTLARSSACC